MATNKDDKKINLHAPAKFSDSNIGRKVKIKGQEHEIDFVSANKQKFRTKQGAGLPVLDFDLNDIEEVTGLVIDIKE